MLKSSMAKFEFEFEVTRIFKDTLDIHHFTNHFQAITHSQYYQFD